MADKAAILSVLSDALFDPAAIVPRREPEYNVYEPLTRWQARAALAALAEKGYTVVRTSELEQLEETASAARGRFPRGEVIKPDRETDFYLVWSHVVEAPSWTGTRAEAIADDCPPSRLRRADETGSSFMPEAPGCRWDDDGLIAEQRGYLPRRNLAAYVTAYMEDRMDAAWDLLEPFDDETPVRRG